MGSIAEREKLVIDGLKARSLRLTNIKTALFQRARRYLTKTASEKD